MGKNVFGFLIMLIFLLSCKQEAKITDSKVSENITPEESFKRVFSDGDYNFQVEYNNRLDTSYLDILYKGKKVRRHGFKGRIKNEFLVDLDNDGKNEVYVLVEKESNEKLYAYYFEDGKTTEIVWEHFFDAAKIISTSYNFVQNQIVEKYKIINSDNKAETRTLRYNLVKRDGGLFLLPQGRHPEELKKMSGQYAARDGSGAGYYKVMLLDDLGGGIWGVDIKVKRNGDKKILCDFNGKGYFLDENLIVPFGDVNPKLKGALKIRFVDLLAVVYTEDPLDNNEMVSFCESVGSIAGNFKKTNI